MTDPTSALVYLLAGVLYWWCPTFDSPTPHPHVGLQLDFLSVVITGICHTLHRNMPALCGFPLDYGYFRGCPLCGLTGRRYRPTLFG